MRLVVTALLALGLLCPVGEALAQQTGTIRGRVVDATTSQPLSVTEVIVTGTSFSTITDENGAFQLVGVPAGLYSVEARRIGYARKTEENVQVTAGGVITVDFELSETALALDEIVVTGVADPTSVRRVPFTIGRVSDENLQVPQANAISALSGRVAGVRMTTPAQPGAGINVMLRTPTSISRGNTPLIVVDGVILASTFSRSSADLSSLDIESIEVVKGAAAASLYGSRAANGVIQIRTRRGTGLEQGKTQFTVRSEIGLNQLPRKISLARHHQYLVDENGQYIDTNGNPVSRTDRVLRPAGERFLDVPYADPVHNHVDAFFDPGRYLTNSITMGRNSEDTNFFVSFTDHKTDGVILDHGGYNRNDFRLNLDHRLASDLTFSVSAFHMKSHRENLPGDFFFQLLQHAPDVDLREPDPDGTQYIFEPDPLGVTPNPLYELVTSRDDEDRVRTLASGDIRWSPTGWFSFDANVSYDRSDRQQRFYFPRGRKTNVAAWQDGRVQRVNGFTSALNGSVSAQLRGTWNDVVGRLTLRALAEKEEYESVTTRVSGLSVEGVPDLNAGTIPYVSGSTQEIKAQGFFAIGSLDYQGRYIFDGLVRRDGSSLFGPEERWHTYYRGSAAWRIAEEDWWSIDDITEFKLRYSIGTAGGRPNFADRFETYSFTDGGGLEKSTLGNRYLKPERSTEQEFGLDLIYRDRITMQLTHARVKTTDQLTAVPLPSAFGFTSQWQNAGTVEGHTWEASIEAALMERPGFRWSMGLVLDRSRHEVTEYNRRCFRTGTANAFYRCEGETLGTMYGTRFLKKHSELPEGVNPQEFQVNDDGLLVWVGQDGDWRDHQWGTASTGYDETYEWGMPILATDELGNSVVSKIGDTNPDFNWGITTNINWKGLSIFALLDAQVGGEIYNRRNQRMYQYFRSGDTDQAGKPQEKKKTTDYYTTLYASNLINQWFVESAGYVKLREVSLRYNVPTTFLERIPGPTVDNVTLFANGRNLFTWTDYKGFDPEAGTPLGRIDALTTYPQFRTITAGLEIRF